MNKIEDLMRRVNEIRNQQLRNLAELAVWEDVKAQHPNVKEDEIKGFGFDPRMIDCEDWLRLNGLAYDMLMFDAPHQQKTLREKLKPGEEWVGPWLHQPGRPRWYNHVMMKDGSTLPLSPMVRCAEERMP